jgi:predicted nucleotidyltransferase
VDALSRVLAEDPRVEYALLFGSSARGSAHPGSDLDVAIGLRSPGRIEPRALGDLVASLERASGRCVDVLLLDEAPPAVAYRVFRAGRVLLEKNHQALVARKARAILEYLDYRPFEERVARGVLTAAADGR